MAVAGLALMAGVVFAYRGTVRDILADRAKPRLPIAQPYAPRPDAVPPQGPIETGTDAAPKPVTKPGPKPAPIAAPSTKEANLAVPFTSQAPRADWSMPYQEACEEASLMMVHAYLSNAGAFTPDEAERQILALVAWQNENFGYYEDTNAEQVVRMAKEFYGYSKSRAVKIDSLEDVKRQVDMGVAVILPASGRLLYNPYFRDGGPPYHMLVVKGYTKDGKIITNDPGTRRGADFLYDPATLWNAVHDWNAETRVADGPKVMVIVEN